MNTITLPITPILRHIEPVIALGDIINAFSSYYQYAIPETPSEHKDGHVQTVAYTQELISRILFNAMDSGQFMKEVEIPYHADCHFLIEGENLETTIKIINRVWDCYLLHNDKVFLSGEISNIFNFTALRDGLCSLIIRYHIEANRDLVPQGSCESQDATQEN